MAVYAIVVLFFANVTNYTDRSVLTLVVQPVKAALKLSDSAVGLMQGAAFVITFATAGLFMGRIVDRHNRRNLLVASVAIWSVSAAACGFAQAGWQLFIGRMGVGVGEAALIPAAVSLISDYFTPARRGIAYGVFSTGIYAGTGCSLMLIGLALPGFADLSRTLADRHGLSLQPWRMVMMSMLLPGVVCCSLLALMREPPRTHDGTEREGVTGAGLREWLEKSRVLLPHHLFSALIALALYGINSWAPTMLIRQYGRSAKEAGLIYGLTVVTVGIAGALSAGFLADVVRRRAGVAGRIVLALAVASVGLVGFAIIALAHDVPSTLLGSVLVIGPLGMSQIVTVLLISDVASSGSRGQITSIYFVFAGIIGTAGGPAAVGLVSDMLATRGSLSTSIAGVGGAATLMAIACGGLMLRSVLGAGHVEGE